MLKTAQAARQAVRRAFHSSSALKGGTGGGRDYEHAEHMVGVARRARRQGAPLCACGEPVLSCGAQHRKAKHPHASEQRRCRVGVPLCHRHGLRCAATAVPPLPQSQYDLPSMKNRKLKVCMDSRSCPNCSTCASARRLRCVSIGRLVADLVPSSFPTADRPWSSCCGGGRHWHPPDRCRGAVLEGSGWQLILRSLSVCAASKSAATVTLHGLANP